MNIEELNIGDVYKFQTQAPMVLGDNYTNMKLIGIVDYSIAIKFADVTTLNKTVADMLNVDNLAVDNTYLMFRTDNDTITIFAYEWLSPDTIEAINSVSIECIIGNILVTNAQTDNDIIVATLKLNNLHNYTIEYLDTDNSVITNLGLYQGTIVKIRLMIFSANSSDVQYLNTMLRSIGLITLDIDIIQIGD